MPWESVLIPFLDLSSVPDTIHVPAELLVDYQNVRDAAIRNCGTTVESVSFYKRVMGTCLKDLQKLDRTITLDFDFLENRAEPLAIECSHREIERLLPDGTCVCDIKAVLLNLEKFRRSDVCVLAGPTLLLDVDGIISLVRGLSVGIGIQKDKLLGLQTFYRKCVKRMENFVTCELAAVGKNGSPHYTPPLMLFGVKAIEEKLNVTARKMKAGDPAITIASMKEFRVYDWLLLDNQRDMRERWLADLVKAEMGTVHRSLTDAPAGGGADGDHGIVALESASSSSDNTKIVASANLELMKMASKPRLRAATKHVADGTIAKKGKQVKGPLDLMGFFVAPQ
jgi:hypothetical protein